MKPILLFCTIAALSLFSACTSKKTLSASADKVLRLLLDQHDYFKLETRLKQYNDSLNDDKRLYFKSYLDNAFNHNLDCIADVDSLLRNYAADFPDSVKVQLSRLQSDSYFKTYQYAKAAQTDNGILKRYAKGLSKDVIDDIKNDILSRGALKNIAPQQTIIKTNTTFPWTRDKLGLIEIPVVCKSAAYQGIFDTRANISTITKTYAAKLGLHILPVTYNEGSGATGIQFKTGMGIADELNIGGVVVKNVVFQVMPDSILYIAPIKYQLNMIIGFPVIEQMKEVDIYKDGRMVIPQIPAQTDLHNFALDGLNPVIALKAGNDTLAFNFDSGASSSVFYVAYFNRYKAAVLKNGIKKTMGFGGAGGSQKKAVYILPKVNLTVGDKTVTVDSLSVLDTKITPDEKLYGNIGQDFTNKFNEVIYNFKYMYMKGN
jgi:Aspartyl protease